MIYFAVWCVIILGAGAIYGGLTPGGVVYGFKAVSLPLTIGMSCGFAFGGICGILTVKVFDPQNKKHGTNTPWGFAHTHLKKIDEDVRKLLISVCVTLLLSAAVAYPYAIGAILGIVIMWQIVVQLYLGKEPDSASKNTETQELISERTDEGAEVPDDHDAGEEATGVSSSMEA